MPIGFLPIEDSIKYSIVYSNTIPFLPNHDLGIHQAGSPNPDPDPETESRETDESSEAAAES